MELTQKQERFAVNLFSGMSQNAAYIFAGYANNTKAIIAVNASRLADNTKILLKIQELRDKAESKKVMSVRERMERLTQFARDAYIKPRDALGAVSELNKMDGAYAPTRTELTGKDGEPIQVDVDAKTKLIGLLSYGAARIQEGQNSQELVTSGEVRPILELAPLGTSQPTTT